jgi:ribonuclease HI
MAKKFYAVAKGRKQGIWEEWYGEEGAWAQVNGFPGAVFKGFATRKEASDWLGSQKENPAPKPVKKPIISKSSDGSNLPNNSEDKLIIYTDGGSIRNPGPGGYGVVMLYKGQRKELSGGFRLTTNNRMELTACIVGLRNVTCSVLVIMHCDSKYVVDGISKGWAKRWRAKGWMRTETEKAKNADLWAELLTLCERLRVEFRWVKGHAGVKENERCDFLVNQEQAKRGLPPDVVYETDILEPT